VRTWWKLHVAIFIMVSSLIGESNSMTVLRTLSMR